MSETHVQWIRDNLDRLEPTARLWVKQLLHEYKYQQREINELRAGTYPMLQLSMGDITEIVQEAVFEMGGPFERRESWNAAGMEVIHAFEKYFDKHLNTQKDATDE